MLPLAWHPARAALNANDAKRINTYRIMVVSLPGELGTCRPGTIASARNVPSSGSLGLEEQPRRSVDVRIGSATRLQQNYDDIRSAWSSPVDPRPLRAVRQRCVLPPVWPRLPQSA